MITLYLSWNIRSVEYPEYGSFWLFEPVPVIAPYYEEVGIAPFTNWGVYYYDQDGNCIGACTLCSQNIYDLLEEATGTLGVSYYRTNKSRVNDIPMEDELLDISNITSRGYTDSLSSLVFGIAKSVAADMFLGDISGPFGRLLGIIGYTDATFSASAVIQTLWWIRGGRAQDDVWVRVLKRTQPFLSDYYDEINRRPLAAVYVIEIYTTTG